LAHELHHFVVDKEETGWELEELEEVGTGIQGFVCLLIDVLGCKTNERDARRGRGSGYAES
jgi:hypothetical protein